LSFTRQYLRHYFFFFLSCSLLIFSASQNVMAQVNTQTDFQAALQGERQNNKLVNIKARPSWVEYRNLTLNTKIPVNEVTQGSYYRLLDSQIQVTKKGQQARYVRYVQTIVNPAGIKDISQINLDYDPSYQTLNLNSLNIIREGKTIDKLTSAKFSLFNREKDLENQIYNGTKTLNILLDDIREGDTIDYSFTRLGVNPVYKNIFSYSREINWSVPIEDQYVRVLWGKEIPLYVRSRNDETKVIETKQGAYKNYQVHMHNAATIKGNDEVPAWFDPYGVIYFSETKSWQAVVSWALPLYQQKWQAGIPANNIHPSIQKVADAIKEQYLNSAEQIAEALRYTQKNIRYVGLEMGINSHFPTPAYETLALRYGDCKDKAVLFIAILNALNINAYPALVNTDSTKLLIEKPPAVNRFDHVIVTLQYQGKRFWLDPTRSYQAGNLSTLFQPDYGYALIVKSGEKQLTSMANDVHNSYSHISEHYVIPEDAKASVEFNVISEYLGDRAQQKQVQIERDGIKKVSQDYEAYYQRTYPKLATKSEVNFSTDIHSGVLTVNENYVINDFWSKEDDGYQIYFYPDDVRNAVYKPKQIKRSAPLWFKYPNNIRNQIIVEFIEDGWHFEKSELIEDNDFFFFKRNVAFVGKTLTLSYDYRSKTDHIAKDKIEAYLAARDTLRDKTSYGITKYFKKDEKAPSTSKNKQNTWLFWGILATVVYLSGLIFAIVSWRKESGKRPNFQNVQFYPVSTKKFIILSLATMGLYSSYWMYRNWKYIQAQQDSAMMPIARGIFYTLWYYPLFRHLKADSCKRFNENRVFITSIALIFALSYVVIGIGSSVVENTWLSLAAFFLPLLYLPMVNYINHLNKQDLQAYQYNSKWQLKHFVMIFLYLPLLAAIIVQQSNIMPNSAIVAGSEISGSNLRFL